MNAKTYSVREGEIDRRWYVVDATDQTLGRLASRIARVLAGKHKPTWAPNLDSGDHVIVLNASRIAVTSDKAETKLYIRHSGYPQGYKEETLGDLLQRHPLPEHRVDLLPPCVVTSVAEPVREPDVVGGEVTLSLG